MKLSVIIPTLNAAAVLPACLDALLSGLPSLREVIVSDGGSTDGTRDLADAAGAQVIEGPRGRGVQLASGADRARGDYLLFLHADTVLQGGWAAEVDAFMRRKGIAATFTLAFDSADAAARVVAAGAMLRTRLFRLPYGDQGLLIETAAYHDVGGYRALPIMEDVDLVERLTRKRGREALAILRARAVTSADRYRRGWARRVLRNAWCLAQYRLGVDPVRIAAEYARP